MRRSALLLVLAGLFTAGLPATAAPPLERFIVVLQPSNAAVLDEANALAHAHGGRLLKVYTHALRGFAVELPAAAVAGLVRSPAVAWVEPDQVVSVAQQTTPTGIDRVEADLNPATLPMNVDIAIIDTGLSFPHEDIFAYRATDCTGAIFYPLFGGCTGAGDLQDGHGHGTHVAGIAAAINNTVGVIGTAPGARIWSLKALDASGNGYLGSILAAVDTVTAYAADIEVTNMSLGFAGASAALDTAITNSVNAGVVYVVAAGNSASDAAGFSPASNPDVITVSALADFDGKPGGLVGTTTTPAYCRVDQDDTLADFSNFGPGVEIAAPGVCIYSTYKGNAYATLSGTSMATPYVTGAVARYLVENNLNPANRTDVLNVRSAIIGAAKPQGSTCGFTGDPDAYPEPLLFVNGAGFGGDGTCEGGAPPNQPPVASFTSSCTDLSCTFTSTSTDPDGTISNSAWDFGDGNSAPGATVTHAFAAGGTYMVDLTVTDDDGAIGSTSQSVTVTAPNQPPVASFTSSCTGLTCTFTSTSTDDGTITNSAWDFGDGGTGSGSRITHTYAAGGTYTVVLTVTDNAGATGSTSQSVTVTTPVVTMSIQSVVVTAAGSRRWNATVTVFSSTGNPVSGATVTGTWSWGGPSPGTRIRSGVTSSTGVVVIASGRLPSGSTGVQFCATSVTGLLPYSGTLPICDT